MKDDTKGVAFDYAKESAGINYSNGSRALTLNTSKGNIVSISGNSKDAAWWQLEDATELVTKINQNRGVDETNTTHEAVRKIIRDGKLVIVSGGKEYTAVGQEIN